MTTENPDQQPESDSPTYRLVRPADEEPDNVFTPARELGQPPAESLWKRLVLGQLPLEAETSYFILVNLLDFFVTYWLLMSGGPGNMRFVESNPVARYFIYSWGPIKGMLGFKLSLVTFVCVVAQLIALKREDLGQKVLIFGTLATAGVVAYSVLLYLRHG